MEVELARDEMYKLFNEANEGDDNDVRCRYEAPTGSRIPERVCFSTAQDRASANGARDFLNSLVPVFALKGPQCEASTYTEHEQLGNVARVTGTVSISACPAGTTGKLALVARIRDEAGAITPIEFSETWQRTDAQDHIFNSDDPIGDNVFLDSVRVRNLTCTCEDPIATRSPEE